jgi:hypothetical protein
VDVVIKQSATLVLRVLRAVTMLLPQYASKSLRFLRSRFFHRLSFGPPSIGYDPYDRTAREDLAQELFRINERAQPFGTVDRGRLILRIIEASYPTQKLASEYFCNLEYLLKAMRRRNVPGQVLLGLGTGRSGSTSLAALLGTVQDGCSTHENPPLIYWTPEGDQVQFHMKRFKLLSEYFSLVSDVSHWWLNVLDEFFRVFPNSKVIGTVRDVNKCAESFMRIKRYGRLSWNHWVPYRNGIWTSHSWDPTYPTYSVPNDHSNPDRAKYELIARYIKEYNAQLTFLATQLPEQVKLVRTDELDDPSIQRALFDYAGVTGRVSSLRFNVRSVSDGASDNFIF